MKGSTVSRRVSEFVGVALFAAALIWIIALATYEPTDPVWFFSAGAHAAPGELRRPRRRVPRRALVPAGRLRRVPASRRAWSSSAGTTSGAATVDAARHEGDRRRAALRLRQRVPEPGPRHARGRRASRSAPAATRATGSPAVLADYLNRTGSVDRRPDADRSWRSSCRRSSRSAGSSRRSSTATRRAGVARRSRSFREWREERRREQQRREVIAKHTKKGAPPPEIKRRRRRRDRRRGAAEARRQPLRRATTRPRCRSAGRRQPQVVRAGEAAEGQPAGAAAAAVRSRADGEGAGRAAQGRVRAAAARAARRAARPSARSTSAS